MTDTEQPSLLTYHLRRADATGTKCGLNYGDPADTTGIGAGDVVLTDDDEFDQVTCEDCRGQHLLDKAIEAMPNEVWLTYVDYRDELTDTQVAAIVRGDLQSLDSDMMDWLSDNEWDGLLHLLEEVLPDEDERDELRGTDTYFENFREEASNRNQSDPVRELANHTGRVLLRIPIDALDEDHAYSFEEVTADQVLNRVMLDKTEHNLREVQYALDNASPEFSVLMGYWIVGADVETLLDLPYDGKVEIVNPYLYLGNPFTGSGFITEKALTGTVTVDRTDLRSDKDAFGYSVNEIYGGLSTSQFEAEIRPVTTEEKS